MSEMTLPSADEIEAHNYHSRLHDDSSPYHPFFKDHEAHGPNPVYRALGWGNEGHCGYDDCAHYDDDMQEKALSASLDKVNWTHHEIDPARTPMTAHESVVDLDHVSHLMANPSDKPVLTTEHGGRLHILDGHHRALAAVLSNRSLNVSVFRGQ